MSDKITRPLGNFSRRALLKTGAALSGAALMSPVSSFPAFAVGEQPPIGTWPAGSQGDTVFIGASVPRTGTYAVQGEDELKGYDSRSSTSTKAMNWSRRSGPRPRRACSARN